MIYFWFIFGAVIGSFLNVVIYRLPRGESIVFPPSRCPACGKRLLPQDLVPVLSFFLLRGKCRYCRDKISFRYPLVEFLTASAFSFAWMAAGRDTVSFIFYIFLISVFIFIFFIDLEQQVIPDAVSAFGVVLGLIYNYLRGGFFPALAGMFLGYFLLYAIGRLGKLLFKKEAMGDGDPYVAALLGANLGLSGVLLAVFLAYLLAAVVSLFLLASGRVKMGQTIPFGPALVAGGIITLFWGDGILSWYGGMFL
ncbi:prepilin peptidase [Candidatus Saganbacteria bacterium]|uniref:Prepilin leader peptidase/N-methyltransferase n=1 Tax=Candidatus Saganbacteria bacterium TaxID=2575572 RepID=A0A9D6YVT6_UNCSA|nr:prepilin peptidase [Candidatus Saganbacteria bacterium]